MSLKELIKTGQKQLAPRIMLTGEEGVGKSTFGNRSENPLFICAENGLVGPEFSNTPNVTPNTWQDVLALIDLLKNDQHNYKTLVFDTIDWLEPLVADFICRRDGKPNIGAYGHGSGYVLEGVEWRNFLSRLENLRAAKNMTILFLTHSTIKSFSNPAGDNYDRYQASCPKNISALTREWCDCVLFARFETFLEKESAKSKAKAVGTDKRVVQTTHNPAWDAKNRYSMPEKMALDFTEVMNAIKTGKPAKAEDIISEINAIVAESSAFSDDDKKTIAESIEKFKTNEAILKQILNKCRVKGGL